MYMETVLFFYMKQPATEGNANDKGPPITFKHNTPNPNVCACTAKCIHSSELSYVLHSIPSSKQSLRKICSFKADR